MEIIDGGYPDFTFSLTRGKQVHFYNITAKNEEIAIKIAKHDFENEYGKKLFPVIKIEKKVCGYPFTKIG